MKLKQLVTIFIALFSMAAQAQKIDTFATMQYIRQYKDIAIREMNRTGIPASITLAQGIHESGIGKSYLAQNTNNHFGIKCHENWTGRTFKYTDDAPNECFRVYDKVEDSYVDHSDFLKNRPRYAALFLLNKNDYQGWAWGLKKAGYATNPSYPAILIKTIEDFQLAAFDKGQAPSYLDSMITPIINNTINGDEIEEDSTIDIQTPVTPTPVQQKPEITTSQIIEAPVVKTDFSKPVHKTIIKINNKKAVKIYNDETVELIGNVLAIEKEDLLAYNDITDDSKLKNGDILFIQRKAKSNKEGTYKVKSDDNIWNISQRKGVRLASLLKMNKLEPGEEPAAKETIYLKGKTDEKPKLRPKTELQIVKSPSGDLGVVRAKDTIYPTIEGPAKVTIDSNKILGWESETKLLEKPAVATYPAKKDTVVKIKVPPAIFPNTPGRSVSIIEREESIIEKPTPTVYPAVIDYSKLPKSTTGFHTVIKGDTMYNIAKRYTISAAQIMEWNNLPDQNIKLGQVLKITP